MSPSSVSRAESRHAQRRRVAEAVDVGLACEHALVAEHVAVVGIPELVADVVDAVAMPDHAAFEATHVDVIADRGNQPVVAGARDIGRAIDLVPGQHGRARHECRDAVVRDREDCAIQRVRAHARREAHVAAARERDLRPAVHPGERELVPRIDEVRVRDLRIDVPDLRPVPGIGQEFRRDVPERVARHDDVTAGRIGRHRNDAAVDALVLPVGDASRHGHREGDRCDCCGHERAQGVRNRSSRTMPCEMLPYCRVSRRIV